MSPGARLFPPLLVLGACTGVGETGAAGPHVVETETVGDTLVVRTVSGSAWGGDARLVPELSIGEVDGDLEYLFGQIVSLAVAPDGRIYVVDRQGPELRVFDPDGSFGGTVGTPGEGPGELGQPDGGLAVLSDGRVLVRDPGNARIQVYSDAGEPLETWPIRGGFSTGAPFHQTYADEVHTTILLDPDADVRDWRMGLVRIGQDGTPGDTLVPPDAPYEPPAIEVRTEGGAARNGVPFAAGEHWAIHPEGYFVHGVATDYRITLLEPERLLRIERVYEPVPVSHAERAEEETRMTRNMRRMKPDWRWNGPPIPDVKPAFLRLFTGRDGRIWVQVPVPSVEVDDPEYDPTDPDSVEDRWREGVAFDVFEADGGYLGRVATEMGFRTYPTPVFGASHVWASTSDELGVQRVVRFRIEPVSAGGTEALW